MPQPGLPAPRKVILSVNALPTANPRRQYPDYQFTNDIALAAIRAGNRNFAGLGRPGMNGRIKR